jgi:hypothetical protein
MAQLASNKTTKVRPFIDDASVHGYMVQWCTVSKELG